MKDAVPPSVAEEIRAVFRRHPQVQRATLFGSRAKGNFREGSDIDLALEGDALEGRHLATMLGELEETPIPQKVDLLLKKTLRHQELLDHIERVGLVFYRQSKHICAKQGAVVFRKAPFVFSLPPFPPL
jgi:predicted nucleotidyltransferase